MTSDGHLESPPPALKAVDTGKGAKGTDLTIFILIIGILVLLLIIAIFLIMRKQKIAHEE